MNPYASEHPQQPGDHERHGPYGSAQQFGYDQRYQDDLNPYAPNPYGRDRTAPGGMTRDGTPTMKRPPTTFAPTVPSSPRITPQTAAAAEQLGYDPTAVNAPVIRRFSALLLDAALYLVILAGIIGISGIAAGAEGAAIATVVAGVLGPAGFFGYRAAGDAVFEGSPGKRMVGLSMGGPHNLPVTGGAGVRRNLWMLTSIIPVLGWLVSLGTMVWIAVGISGDPLGRGPHERWAGTRVVETPPKPLPSAKPKTQPKSVKPKKNKALNRAKKRKGDGGGQQNRR